MAYMIIPTPGDKFLCGTPCSHKDCAEHRKNAEQICHLCNKPLGYGSNITSYLKAGTFECDRVLVHWECAIKDSE